MEDDDDCKSDNSGKQFIFKRKSKNTRFEEDYSDSGAEDDDAKFGLNDNSDSLERDFKSGENRLNSSEYNTSRSVDLTNNNDFRSSSLESNFLS